MLTTPTTRKTATLVALAAALTLGACASKNTVDAKDGTASLAVNTMCPMMPEHSAKGGPTTEYKGKTIGFCCTDCVDEFNKLTEVERDAVLAKAMVSKAK